ncbi:ribosome silencing factor [candidate division CSSED10-310 bacterium]|uniref:Ribosomal silencing factor RsfS n=1 Tax=candidate division CSSED10-310 bacterium TaxID=2855610 RepID=A0ABV6YS91_UNCC1
MVAPGIPGLLKEIYLAIEDKKGENPLLLDLRGLTSLTDFFFIVSAWSERQVRAIQNEIEQRLRQNKVRPLHKEGEESGRWVLLDYGYVIVHIFLHETRKYYELEHLWADAPLIDLAEEFKQT